jgi:hypothetical protein
MAIDVLLEPDAVMLERAQADNSRLLQAFPAGFPLDDAHRPHVTLIQCFVRTEDLEAVHAVCGEIFAGVDGGSLVLEAVGIDYVSGDGVGLAGIAARPTPALLQLQQQIISAVAPFMLAGATIEAFSAGHGDPALDQALIDYVATFVPAQAGERFSPHVTTGVAPTAVLDAMVAEPFEPFRFACVGGAVYQLGPYGTAARRLRQWPCS